MALLDFSLQKEKSLVKGVELDKFYAVDKKGDKAEAVVSSYSPTDNEKQIREMVVKHFRLGDMTMRKPRREFNDLSVLTRTMVDQMSFNAYQPNNGDALEGDEINSWRSRAMRPIARNKVVSIAAHATARLIFPKIFAFDEQNEEQRECAQVMEDLMEWAGNQADWSKTALYATISSLVNPACIIHTEYAETYRTVKRGRKPDGGYETETLLDEDYSGFKDAIVPVDELYIENIYEHDIQKQGWLIRRRLLSYENADIVYSNFPNWKFVRPGVQLIYNDANSMFYEVYDSNMRQELVEEVVYWNKNLDLKLILVNGVLLTEADNPNPRNDKLYPFVKFGYELIDEGKFFYYKSLIFKMQQDEKIVNTLYPMIIDGTYLNLFPPMVAMGAEAISSNVIIPGAVTTLSSPDANLRPIQTSVNINDGVNALFKVEQSINETTNDQFMMGMGQKRQTAYAMSMMQQNANILLGLFVQMISQEVKEFGRLRLGDILQFMTIAEANQIDDSSLVYKTFLVNNKEEEGQTKTRKIKFDSTLPDKKLSDEEKLKLSYETLAMGGGMDSKSTLYRVNPVLYRNLKFMVQINPDVLNPVSEEMEKQFGLEAFDKSIAAAGAGVPVDMEQAYKDFVLRNYPISKKDPQKYIKKEASNPQQNAQIPQQIPQQPGQQTGSPMPQLQSPTQQAIQNKL